MSTQTTPGGPVIGIALLRTFAEPENEQGHAQVVHGHVEADIPESLGLKNLQVGDSGNFDADLPDGIVAESATVTEYLDVIDDAFIRVQPNEVTHQSAIWIGFDPKTMTDKDTGLFVHRGADVITLNHEVGIRAPNHPVAAATFVSEWNVNAGRAVTAGTLVKSPEVRTSRIQKYMDKHTHITVTAPLTFESGGLNVSNADSTTVLDKGLDMKQGDIICRNLFAAGIVEGGSLRETVPKRKHDGTNAHHKTVTVDDDSLYIGLMRRSYNRVSHKPVTHILKRQIPAYLVAAGFTLGDIPSPFTVDNMTVNNWVTLAQEFTNDTNIEVDTVFPTTTTADWEDYIDPISIDLDAAEVEIDGLDTRITALEAAGGGGGELSSVTLVTATANDQIIYLADNVVGLVLVEHANLTGVECVLPSTLSDGDIILVKNYNTTDGGDNHIKLTVAWDPVPLIPEPLYLFDDRWTSIQLNGSSVSNANVDTYSNQCARLLCKVMDPGGLYERKVVFRLNDSY